MAVTSQTKVDAHRLRADFPIFEQSFHGRPLAFLDSAASSQKPRQVLDAMTSFYETSYANVHRGVYELAERATAALEEARTKACRFVNAPAAREIVFVRNATEAINLVAYAWGLSNLGPGDTVLVTELEHHSNYVPWQYIARRTGAEFRMVPLDDAGELRLDCLDEYENVKVVATGLVSNSLGTVNDVARVAAWAHERGAVYVCDAAQAAPHKRIDVQALGCDFLAVSGHKMCGPSGIGFLWGRAELLQRMEPFLLGGHMIRKVGRDATTWGELPHKFEAGTAPMAEAVGLGAAIDYLEAVRPRGDRGARARARRLTRSRRSARSPASRCTARRPSAGPASSASTSTAFTRTTSRRSWTRRGRDPRRPPLLPAADGEARRRGDEPCELLPLHGARGDRPARGRGRACEGAVRVNDFDQLYREVILDHYKNPRGHGLLDDADAHAEGNNPLCGDEIAVSVRFGDDGDTIADVGFEGRGCAISQAATSMLTELVKGRTVAEVAALPKEDLLEEIGIQLTPVRLKCAILGLGVLKVALHRSKGTPLPEEWQGLDLG